MATLAETRTALAGLLSAVPMGSGTLAVRRSGPVGAPKPGDGWVTVRRLTPNPDRFGTAQLASLEALIVAGPDEAAAEAFIDTYSPAVLAAALASDLPFSAVSIDHQLLIVGTTATAPLYCLVLAVTVETE